MTDRTFRWRQQIPNCVIDWKSKNRYIQIAKYRNEEEWDTKKKSEKINFIIRMHDGKIRKSADKKFLPPREKRRRQFLYICIFLSSERKYREEVNFYLFFVGNERENLCMLSQTLKREIWQGCHNVVIKCAFMRVCY